MELIKIFHKIFKIIFRKISEAISCKKSAPQSVPQSAPKFKNSSLISVTTFLIGVLCSILTSHYTDHYIGLSIMKKTSQYIISTFIESLKFISLPLIFSSIISSLINTKNQGRLIRKLMSYTFFTTIIASIVSIITYIMFFFESIDISKKISMTNINFDSVAQYIISIIPRDIFSPFIQKNPLSVAMLAFILIIGIRKLSSDQKFSIQKFFFISHNIFMNLAKFIINLSPIAFWAFGFAISQEITQESHASESIFKYFLCISTANCIHALIFIPLILKIKKISPFNLFKKVFSVLVFAFFSKSSASTLPLAMEAFEKKINIENNSGNDSKYNSKHNSQNEIYKSTLPLCTILNMNACAAFIATSTLFAHYFYNITIDISTIFSIFIVSIISALGNAGIPMGCFFMATSYLSAISLNTDVMQMILPFYLILDMLETSTNIWSDISVTMIVSQDINKENQNTSKANQH